VLNWCNTTKNAGINQQIRIASKNQRSIAIHHCCRRESARCSLPNCAVGVGLQKPQFDGHFRACSVHINLPGERHKIAAKLLIFRAFNVSIYPPTC
jgi:hypothetical protein